MRLLGTSPAPSSRFPPPAPLFSLSVVLSACLPWSFLCLSSAAGPARRGQIQSDLAMVCLGWLNNGPSSGSLSSWPRGLVRECCPAGRPWTSTSTSLPRTSNRWSSQHLALFSSAPRGCCTRIWPTVGGSPGPPLSPSSNATHVGSEGL